MSSMTIGRSHRERCYARGEAICDGTIPMEKHQMGYAVLDLDSPKLDAKGKEVSW